MIDVHTHPAHLVEMYEQDPQLHRAVRDVFGLYYKPHPLADYLAGLDEAGIDRAVVLPIDCSSAHGCRILTNEAVRDLVDKHPRLIGFASVDPNVAGAPETLERAVREYGLQGLKLDPCLQRFRLDDEVRAFPVYAACAELGIPMLVHCGLNWAPEGRAIFGRPLDLEAMVCQFPDLPVIIAHCGWPFVDEALLLALKHPNVYLDTAINYSGTPTDSLRRVLQDTIGLDVIDRSLRDKLLFGSDYPRVDPKRVVRGIRSLGLNPQLEDNVFHANAAKVLGLEESRP